MAADVLEFDTEPLFAFVQRRVPGLLRREHMVGIGLRKRGELVAAAIFEEVGRRNAFMHLAGDGHAWLSRRLLRALATYAFVVCGLTRVSATIQESNGACRRLAEHAGFELEARLSGVAEDGGDVLIYVLWAKGYRYGF
jgi:L-amino acid N-acyltransferase YncA